MTTTIALSIPCPAWHAVLPDAEALCRRAAAAAVGRVAAARRPLEVSVVLSDLAEVRALNRDYRGRDQDTNVLSFPGGEDLGAATVRPALVGDVILSLAMVRREAGCQGKSIADHTAHLVVHGVLHLFGYDHESDGEAEVMEQLERDILAELGVGDPFESGEAMAARRDAEGEPGNG